jgi:hypothetical protein
MEDSLELDTEEAQGGPVKRPPPQPSAGKGKISHKTAKMIWVVCIAICVVAVAAVVVDMTLDPLKRRTAVDNGAESSNLPVFPQKRDRPALTEKQKLAREFAVGTNEKKKNMEGSRAYDFVRVAIKKARQTSEAAGKDRGNEELWKEAWLAYYGGRYALELFRESWKFDGAKVPMVSSLDDMDSLEQLEEEELKSSEAQSHLAASLLYDGMDSELRAIERNMDPVAKASKVKADNDDVKLARKKWEAARDKREFDQADKDDVNRPPRGADEPPPYLD